MRAPRWNSFPWYLVSCILPYLIMRQVLTYTRDRKVCKMPMFQRVGIVEGRVPLPLPLAFHYLIVMIRRFKLGHDIFTGSKMTSPYSWNVRFSAIVLPCPFYGSKILGPSKTFWWCTNCCGQVNQENRVFSVSYSFCGNYSFSNLEIIENSTICCIFQFFN